MNKLKFDSHIPIKGIFKNTVKMYLLCLFVSSCAITAKNQKQIVSNNDVNKNVPTIIGQDNIPEENISIDLSTGLIAVFPNNPKEGKISRHQVPGKKVWIDAIRLNHKTRQLRISSLEGSSGAQTPIRFIYPFGAASATWNMDVVRNGDTVTALVPWNGTFIGERMDVDEGVDIAESMRTKLGVTGPEIMGSPVLYSSGDSISNGYWPYLEDELWQEFNVYYQREMWKDILSATSLNNGHAHLAYASLVEAYKNENFSPDYIMVNFGLHMIRTHGEKLDEYGQWVQKFIDLAKKNNTDLIWVTTTPYALYRAQQNVTIKQFNEIASQIAKENNVPIIDLYSCTEELVKEFDEWNVYIDGVHFREDIKEKQALFIANRIREISKLKVD